MKKIILILFISLIFAGCNFEDVFSKLATSDIELAAQNEYNQSKIIEAKQQRIEEKKQKYPEISQLINISDTTKFVAVAFRDQTSDVTKIEVEATLTNPDSQIYEVWLRGVNPKEIRQLGAMQFNQTDDYSLTYSTPEKMTDFNTIVISRESVPDDKPETIIMTGAFQVMSATPSAASN